MYKLLQYSGHVLGVPLMIVVYIFWSKSKAQSEGLVINQRERLLQVLHLVGVETVLLIVVGGSIPFIFPSLGIYPSVGKFAVTAINMNVVAVLCYSLYFQSKNGFMFISSSE